MRLVAHMIFSPVIADKQHRHSSRLDHSVMAAKRATTGTEPAKPGWRNPLDEDGGLPPCSPPLRIQRNNSAAGAEWERRSPRRLRQTQPEAAAVFFKKALTCGNETDRPL
jgi:hypothetical protein